MTRPECTYNVHIQHVRERQLRLYGHVARLTAEDLAHSILSCRDARVWTMPRGRYMVALGGVLSEGYGHDGPGVCFDDGQTEPYLMDTGMTGLASAWAMARRRPI